MHRFYLPESSFSIGRKLIFPTTEIEHLHRSLRLQPGDQVEVFNGIDQLATVRLELVSHKEVLGTVLSVQAVAVKQPRLNLFVGILKNQNLNELVVQKATELGVAEINFIVSDFTQQQWVSQLSFKQERLQKIAIEACKQAEHVIIPQITVGQKLADVVNQVNGQDLNLFATLPRQTDHDVALLPGIVVEHQEQIEADKVTAINLVIGPEGGLSAAEHVTAAEAGFKLVTLGGELVLRTETAVIACLAVLQTLLMGLRQG